jgi:hypothetical protein
MITDHWQVGGLDSTAVSLKLPEVKRECIPFRLFLAGAWGHPS